MTRRTAWTWGSFAVCAVLALAAVAYVSYEVVRLAHNDAEARHRAAFEERVRLALWRMDGYLGPWLAAEQARAIEDYRALRPVAHIWPPNGPLSGEAVAPSPLLLQQPPHVYLYAEVDVEGTWSSPQVPEERFRELAEEHYVEADALARAEERLQRMAALVSLAELETLLGQRAFDVADPEVPVVRLPAPWDDPTRGNQMALNTNEWAARGRARDHQMAVPQQMYAEYAEFAPHRIKPLLPLLLDGGGNDHENDTRSELLLARRVADERGERLQLVWLDGPNVLAALKEQIADLLPEATLVTAAAGDDSVNLDRALTMLPLTLEVEPPAFAPPSLLRPAESAPPLSALALVWAAVLMALAAVAALLSGLLRLSHRRALFVATVSHELRTPLTTFRLYTDLLAHASSSSSSPPPEASRQTQYVETLKGEAERLGHLLDNVLAASRLERRSLTSRETLDVREFLDACEPSLRERLRRAGLELVLQHKAEAESLRVVADRTAVERILFNLADNACKYAANEGGNPTVEITVGATKRHVRIAVRDHGPGCAAEAQRKLFRPFTAATTHASHGGTAGIGLGLALSRRLARDLGGDLRHTTPTDGKGGASFELTLRRTTTTA